MTPALFAIDAPGGEQPGGPERLLGHAATEVRTYRDHRHKTPFAAHYAAPRALRWATSEERAGCLAALAAAHAERGRTLIVSNGEAGLAAAVDALAPRLDRLISVSGRGGRPGAARAAELGLGVAIRGARDGAIGAIADGGDLAEAAAGARAAALSVHLDVLDPLFAPGAGLGLGGGWSTRELVRAIRGALGPAVCVVEIAGYDPHRDRHDLALVAGAAVLQAVTEAWR